VQEWVDIATSKLSQPERIQPKLYFSPVGKKRNHTIAFGVFEYTVDEDDLKAFLEEKAKKREEVSY
jgi:hypothetical protein